MLGIKFVKKRINYVRNRYENLNPWALSRLCVNILNYIVLSVGVRVLMDAKLYFYSLIPVVAVGQHFFLAFYTIYHFWSIDKLRALQAIPAFAIAIPVCKKYSLVLSRNSDFFYINKGFCVYYETVSERQSRLRSFIRFSVDNIFVNRKPRNEYEQLQLVLARRMLKQLLFNIFGVLLSYPIILIGPLYVFIYKNQYSVPTGVIVPFIDPDTFKGFAINMSIQSLAILVGVGGILFTEGLMSIADSNVYTMKELIKFHLRQLNGNISRKDKVNWNQIEEEMTNIWYLLDDLSSYIREYSDVIYYKAFIQPTFAKICVAIAIFCQYVVIKHTYFQFNVHLII